MPKRPESLPSRPKSSSSKVVGKEKGQETTTQTLTPFLPREQGLISYGWRNIQARAALSPKWLTASNSIGAAPKMELHLKKGATNGFVATQKNAKDSKAEGRQILRLLPLIG